jgi:hypothetical protein
MERRRLGETEERPVVPPNGGRVNELVDLSGRTQRSRVARVERERRLRLRCGTREEGNGTRVWGRGGAPRSWLICGASQREDPTVGRRRINSYGGRGGRVWGVGGGPLVGRATLVPGIGPLSSRLISGRASGRPAVLGLRTKH